MKHRLDEEYAFSCLLLGLVSSEPPHTLCWHLNKTLKLSLGYSGEQLVKRKERSLGFDYFRYRDELTQAGWILTVNKDEDGVLVPELKKFDYLLLVEDYDHVNAQQVLIELRRIAPVLGCYTFPIETLKSRGNLIFDE
ncbi:MAG: IPExxxVDY family protein [Flavobacteriales bacterium]